MAVACIFTWYWRADLCAREGIPFVLGHALSRKAIDGGKAQNDTIDSEKIALLLRGGRLPKADVYPAKRRATRDLLRRRTHLMRNRSELLSHVPNTHSPYTRPEIGKQIAYQANREGVAERLEDPAVHKTLAVDLALLTSYDEVLKDLELHIFKTAKHHDANTLYLLQTIPGSGNILRLVRLYDIHPIERFPSVQEVASYGRLVTWSQESGGKRLATSGQKIGNAHLKGAFSEAATLLLRHPPQGQNLLARLEKQHDQGKALSLLAHQRGRAVYSMLKRQGAFDLDILLQTSGSRAGEPSASLDSQGMRRHQARGMVQLDCLFERQGVPRPLLPEP